MARRIDELYAVVSIDQEGDENVVAFQSGGVWWLMTSAHRARMESFVEVAEQLGRPFRVVKFSTREDVTREFLPHRFVSEAGAAEPFGFGL